MNSYKKPDPYFDHRVQFVMTFELPQQEKVWKWIEKHLDQVVEEERDRILNIETSMPQTNYKTVFERIAFQQGYVAAIQIIKGVAKSIKDL